MYSLNATIAIDSYKLGHVTMYPEGTTKVYSNFTARSFKHLESLFPKDLPFFNNKAVVFGISSAVKEINDAFQLSFFDQPKDVVISEFREAIRPFIGDNSPDEIVSKMEALYDLGYLPIKVKSLPEGTMVGPNIPMMTITNTHPDFAWLTNYLETFISSQIWKLSTTATIAKVYKNIFDYFAQKTGTAPEFTLFQGHDFSSRGMSGMADAARSGAGHLTSFMGSDSVSSVDYVKRYYKAEGFIAGSVPASEHSIMTMGLEEGEIDTFRRIFKKFPNGVVSIVSDSYDYWDTITNKARVLKDEIMARGKDSIGLCKTVFRPDSGDPVDVICGTKKYTISEVLYTPPFTIAGAHIRSMKPEEKGSVHCLYDIFGGTKTDTGHIQLDEHVGLIYGDSITPVRAYNILKKLDEKGFASGNIVLGIGSYTYNYLTRDSLGFAMKATYAEINGKGIQIYKAPKTDSGKKSAKGMLRVDKIAGEYVLVDGLDNDEGGELKVIFEDGKFQNLPTFKEIRDRLANA
jgi:nicotinamide phosphoribosyltransferase